MQQSQVGITLNVAKSHLLRHTIFVIENKSPISHLFCHLTLLPIEVERLLDLYALGRF